MKKSSNYKNSIKSTIITNGEKITTIDSQINTFDLQRRVMKSSSDGKSPRDKETNAVNEAMYLANKYRNERVPLDMSLKAQLERLEADNKAKAKIKEDYKSEVIKISPRYTKEWCEANPFYPNKKK